MKAYIKYILICFVTAFLSFSGLKANFISKGFFKPSDALVIAWPFYWLDQEVGSWRNDILEKKLLKPEDFEEIDFSMPGEKGFGDNAKNEFFNPNGPFKFVPIEQEKIDSESTKQNNKPMFNLRRDVEIRGQVRDTLFVMIPYAKCTPDNKYSIFVLDDNRTVVGDTRPLPQCFFALKNKFIREGIMPDKQKVIFHAIPIVSRYLNVETNKWTVK